MFFNNCFNPFLITFAEVVERKGERQVTELGIVRQGHIRQDVEGGTSLQTDHSFSGVWENEGKSISGEVCPCTAWEGWSHQAGREAPCPNDLYKEHQGRGWVGCQYFGTDSLINLHIFEDFNLLKIKIFEVMFFSIYRYKYWLIISN